MKSKHLVFWVATVAAVTGITACSTVEKEKDKEKESSISMENVPAVVKTTLATYAADSEVKKAERGDQDGKQVYEFDIEKGTRKFEVAISPDGKFLGTEEDVELKDLPDAAQKALDDLANGGKISGTEKATDADNKVTYEADITTGGKKMEVNVSTEGKVIKSETQGDEKSEKSEKKDKD